MEIGPMEWWYWFGRWVFGILSILLAWWMILDASRRKGNVTRFIWPSISAFGCLLQIPAIAINNPAVQQSGGGIAAGIIGIGGLILMSIAAVAYFTKGSGSGGTWFTRTRDIDSSSSRSRERRTAAGSARASVPLSGGNRTSRPPTHVPALSEDAPAAETPAAPVENAFYTPATAVKRAGTTELMDAATSPTVTVEGGGETITDEPQAGAKTVVEEAAPAARTVVEDDGDVHGTVVDDPEDSGPGTVVDEESDTESATIVEDDDSRDATITDEPSAGTATVVDEDSGSPDLDKTVTDEPEHVTPAAESAINTIVDDGISGAQLVITDGKSTRLVITERSGPFLVGRDPGKCSLAVDDSRISRQHFQITRAGGEYVISDLGSSNGTFVNGELVRDARTLQDGDMVEFGRTIARFTLDEADADV